MVELAQGLRRRFPSVWRGAEAANAFVVRLLWTRTMDRMDKVVHAYTGPGGLVFSRCDQRRWELLHDFLSALDEGETLYFKPFPFTRRSVRRVASSGSYRFYLAFRNRECCGVFFLRLFVDKRAFLGLAVGTQWRGLGIGHAMIRVLTAAARAAGFALYSTVCSENTASYASHVKNGAFRVVKHLQGGYLLMKASPTVGSGVR